MVGETEGPEDGETEGREDGETEGPAVIAFLSAGSQPVRASFIFSPVGHT
jgi:hypothetical protein